jgi:hypothetical protein
VKQVLVLAIAAAVGHGLDAQTSAGTNRVISPAVVAYWQSQDNGDGTGRLGVLVLWRGTPGWFTRAGGSSGGGGASGGFGKWSAYYWMAYGEVRLDMAFTSDGEGFPPSSTTLSVLGREIALRDANVVLIDGADTGHPAVVGTRYVDPAFTGRDPVAAAIQRSPELFEFLRCDARMPDAAQQSIVEAICRQMQPSRQRLPP